jgi:hypothetical protein
MNKRSESIAASMLWLGKHAHEHHGQWVAVQDGQLLGTHAVRQTLVESLAGAMSDATIITRIPDPATKLPPALDEKLKAILQSLVDAIHVWVAWEAEHDYHYCAFCYKRLSAGPFDGHDGDCEIGQLINYLRERDRGNV